MVKDTTAAPLISQAIKAYNSPQRTHYPLQGRYVSNLEAARFYLKAAHRYTSPEEQLDINITLANLMTFTGDIKGALTQYQTQLTFLPDNHPKRALLLNYLAVWHHANNDNLATTTYLNALERDFPLQASRTHQLITTIERVIHTPINYQTPSVPNTIPPSQHAIVILGHKLLPTGNISPMLEQRLATALSLANNHPQSMLIVSGGMAVNGKTEAMQMKAWLIEQGIDPQRIIKEDQATNTIDNARYSLHIVSRHNITVLTLVSASIHVHRSEILFRCCLASSPDGLWEKPVQTAITNINHLAVSDGLSPHSFPFGQTRYNCYIDALRGSGYSAFIFKNTTIT
ncbi:YdcF family protein [Photobacterium aquae]|nr:YdcF family protein [Photobacterium aquae]